MGLKYTNPNFATSVVLKHFLLLLKRERNQEYLLVLKII